MRQLQFGPARVALCVVATVGLSCVPATTGSLLFGAIITYDLDSEYSGGTAPAGAGPWLRARFDDGGSSGSVTMTLTALNLVGSEFVSIWDFNLDPALNPANLVFSAPTKTGTFGNPAVETSIDAFRAGGSGKYDIEVHFDIAPPADRFGPGDSVEYTITGIPSLTASSFSVLNGLGGGHGPFYTAAHVQGIGAGGSYSGWITDESGDINIPEPASLSVAAAGISMVSMVRLRRRRAASQA
jgi:hypothetical protein